MFVRRTPVVPRFHSQSSGPMSVGLNDMFEATRVSGETRGVGDLRIPTKLIY